MKERITPDAAQALLARAGGQRYVTLFKHGSLELEYYQPVKTDPQQPHTRDEVYFVISGRGTFVMQDQRLEFGPGEVIYAPARVPHHFEQFSDDFATWAIFAQPG